VIESWNGAEASVVTSNQAALWCAAHAGIQDVVPGSAHYSATTSRRQLQHRQCHSRRAARTARKKSTSRNGVPFPSRLRRSAGNDTFSCVRPRSDYNAPPSFGLLPSSR
jgi:hypothetical protein